MTIISAKVIKRPRSYQTCMFCNRMIRYKEPRLRIFGRAFDQDPVSVVYECLSCALKTLKHDKKVGMAIQKYYEGEINGIKFKVLYYFNYTPFS